MGIPAHTTSPHAVQSRSMSPPAQNNDTDVHQPLGAGAADKAKSRGTADITDSHAADDTQPAVGANDTIMLNQTTSLHAPNAQTTAHVRHNVMPTDFYNLFLGHPNLPFNQLSCEFIFIVC